eukprot:TRINITY_DN10950_c0_g1_i1.p1 TRINITY_DN10950_c0_g1~~TRINITY_DN10950_c0_g1_i1.p1  ORF type:complete len:440 (+),score=80.43 TRINITY_DN10950_c0_g1_i1:398-1717(+)
MWSSSTNCRDGLAPANFGSKLIDNGCAQGSAMYFSNVFILLRITLCLRLAIIAIPSITCGNEAAWDQTTNQREFRTQSHDDSIIEAESDRYDSKIELEQSYEDLEPHLNGNDDSATSQGIQILEFTLSSAVIDLQQATSMTFRLSFISEVGIFTPEGSMMTYPSQAVLLLPNDEVRSVMFMPAQHLVDGDIHQGIMESPLELSRWNVPEGQWQVAYIMLVDMQGQQYYVETAQLEASGFPASFTVTNSLTDNITPRLCYWGWHASRWDYVGTQELAITWDTPTIAGIVFVQEQGSGLSATLDDHSDASRVTVRSIDSPGSQQLSAYFGPENKTSVEHGMDASCRAYRIELHMPQWAWAGQWEILEIQLVDAANNAVLWTADQLRNQGMNTPVYVGNKNLTFYGETVYDYHDPVYIKYLQQVQDGEMEPLPEEEDDDQRE